LEHPTYIIVIIASAIISAAAGYAAQAVKRDW